MLNVKLVDFQKLIFSSTTLTKVSLIKKLVLLSDSCSLISSSYRFITPSLVGVHCVLTKPQVFNKNKIRIDLVVMLKLIVYPNPLVWFSLI